MKKVIWLAILLLTTGCASMTPQERQVAYIIGGVVVAGVIISANSSHGHAEPNCFFIVTATGSDQVCR